ncbi:MAG: aminotransferase DegT [Acidimicrobiia bacterium]|nr:MAG: aminotransferase DegT [Acidimicrobiia bacterium]
MIVLSRPSIGEDEVQAVVDVLRSGILASGSRVEAFEEAFAQKIGVDHAVAVGSGTAALHLGLLAMGIGPGHEVIVPSFTFAATANVIRMVGADPVFVDVDPLDYTISAQAVEGAITEKTKAIMPVHLYGHPAPMGALEELAREAGIDLIEDAAQAHLAKVGDRFVGSIGRFAAFSFYPTKNMTTGEGGMITTWDEDIAERTRMLRNQGMAERYVHRLVGLNERMTEIEAAIGLVQLAKLEHWTERRRQIAAIYRDCLYPSLGLPVERPGVRHVYHQFTLCPPDRGPVIAALERVGIGYGVYYPIGVHQQEPYRHLGYHLPVTEDLCERVVSIPIRPDLTDEEIAIVIDTLNEVAP